MVPRITDGEKVILAGTEWIIPPLRGFQIKKVVPRLQQLMQEFQTAGTMSMDIPDKGNPDGPPIKVAIPITTERAMELLFDIYFYSLAFNYPDLKRDVFDNMVFGPTELQEGVEAIRIAVGIKPRAEVKSDIPLVKPGEAGAP